jgi:CRISPR system Cascade subunit CasD
MRCLILRLEGPLMSFGDTAIDEIRPTRLLPGRSLLAGLIGNALGFEHRDVNALQRLQERLLFAARLDQAGEDLLDYQTALIGKKDPIWITRGHYDERGGGTWEKEAKTGRDVQTVQRYRHYRANSKVTVAMTLDPPDEVPDLEAVQLALERPERPLFIGRKGCPPSRPIFDRVVEADSLVAALDQLGGEGRIETEALETEPAGRRLQVADRRDWRMGFHAGLSQRRVLREGTP